MPMWLRVMKLPEIVSYLDCLNFLREWWHHLVTVIASHRARVRRTNFKIRANTSRAAKKTSGDRRYRSPYLSKARRLIIDKQTLRIDLYSVRIWVHVHSIVVVSNIPLYLEITMSDSDSNAQRKRKRTMWAISPNERRFWVRILGYVYIT